MSGIASYSTHMDVHAWCDTTVKRTTTWCNTCMHLTRKKISGKLEGYQRTPMLHSLHHGWVHFTYVTLIEKQNYSIVLNICTKDLETKNWKAIKSLVVSIGFEPPPRPALTPLGTPHLASRRCQALTRSWTSILAHRHGGWRSCGTRGTTSRSHHIGHG
jgi:hypothetical protein